LSFHTLLFNTTSKNWNTSYVFFYLSQELSHCYIGSGTRQGHSRGHTQTPTTRTSKSPFTRASSLDSPIRDIGHVTIIPAGTQDAVWGVPTSLQGQLGPICIFNEGLVEYYHSAWHNAGMEISRVTMVTITFLNTVLPFYSPFGSYMEMRLSTG
jgi:hypothetical protein